MRKIATKVSMTAANIYNYYSNKDEIYLAIQTGATIVPIAIRNSHEIQPGKRVGAVLGQTVQVEIGRKQISQNDTHGL